MMSVQPDEKFDDLLKLKAEQRKVLVVLTMLVSRINDVSSLWELVEKIILDDQNQLIIGRPKIQQYFDNFNILVMMQ